jgi:hypothetical protein
MKKTHDISQIFRRLRVPASSKLDERVHREIDNAVTSPATAPAGPELTLGQIFALFLKRPSARYTLATTLGLAVLVTLALIHSTPSAWAMEQTIEALKKYRALHITGYVTKDGKAIPLDLWARADVTGNLVETGLLKTEGATIWTRDNKTYAYDQSDNTVYVEPGITTFGGLNPWPGPKSLTVLTRLKDYKAFEGDDPATGRKRVVVTCSIENIGGPQSFGPQSLLLEFDVRTKLLVSSKSWQNSTQEGAPNCCCEKILYFEDLPDGVFDYQPPSGASFTNMPLTIPEASLPSLSDPGCGISAQGMSRQQACQKILAQYWAARITNDLARIRQLWPLTAPWPDQLLRDVGDQEQVAQVLKIGGIERTGESKLGPLALVPSWVRYRDGMVLELWLIVQFRETDRGDSCVIYGDHGYAPNAKE